MWLRKGNPCISGKLGCNDETVEGFGIGKAFFFVLPESGPFTVPHRIACQKIEFISWGEKSPQAATYDHMKQQVTVTSCDRKKSTCGWWPNKRYDSLKTMGHMVKWTLVTGETCCLILIFVYFCWRRIMIRRLDSSQNNSFFTMGDE